MKTLEEELPALLDQGLVFDRSKKPYRPTVTIVGTQRADQDMLILVEDFLISLQRRYPFAKIIVGDTSQVEKQAVTSATMLGLDYEIVEKVGKDEWDAGSNVRDERVVAKSSHVVVVDDSARSKTYKTLAQRQGKHFSSIKATTPGEAHDKTSSRVPASNRQA